MKEEPFPSSTTLNATSNSAYLVKYFGSLSCSKQQEAKKLSESWQDTETLWGKVALVEVWEPVMNLSKSSRSWTEAFLTKLWSIWKTLSLSTSSQSSKWRQFATDSCVTLPLWMKHSSKSCGFFSISIKRPRVERPFLNWSRIDFLLTSMSWTINDCKTSSLFAGCEFKIRKGLGSLAVLSYNIKDDKWYHIHAKSMVQCIYKQVYLTALFKTRSSFLKLFYVKGFSCKLWIIIIMTILCTVATWTFIPQY